MAIGKNKRISKKGKGGKKKVVDPMSKKEWYELKAPNPFDKRLFGKTLCTRTTGTKIASDRLKGRVVEVSLADLNSKSEQLAWRKMKLCIEDIQGRNCMTNFHGMDVTRDKLCQFVRKWQNIIEAHQEVKTADGYVLRLFCIAFTARVPEKQLKKTSYAQMSQIKQIRKKMMDIMTKEAAASTLTELVRKFVTEYIGEQIKKSCQFIYPLSNVLIRKVKTLKKPKFDITKLNELYKDGGNVPTGNVIGGKDKFEGEEGTKNLLAE
jgi:small subunit ribosomal protein S3Ae